MQSAYGGVLLPLHGPPTTDEPEAAATVLSFPLPAQLRDDDIRLIAATVRAALDPQR